jgi:hypothetical protein
MSTDRRARGTSPAIRRFEIWFGGIFLTIGIVALLAGTVVYLALHDDPLLGRDIWAFIGAPLAIGVMFSLLGGAFVLRGLAKVRRAERLLQSGTVAEATVVAVEPTSTRVNRRMLWHVRYRYEDLTGGAHRGESGYLEPEEAQSFHVGDRVFVRYDPAHPATSAWIGREELPGQV